MYKKRKCAAYGNEVCQQAPLAQRESAGKLSFNVIEMQRVMDAFRLEHRSALYTVSYKQDG